MRDAIYCIPNNCEAPALRAENERLRDQARIADQCVLDEAISAATKAKDAEIARLQAERDNWEAVCSGSLKEQFRLARENEARLKLALDQLDKAAVEIRRLQAELDLERDYGHLSSENARLQMEADHWRASYGNTVPKLEAENARLRAEVERWRINYEDARAVASAAIRTLEQARKK